MGLAVFISDDELLYEKCGSPGCIAPEILRAKGYSYKADIFSLGAIFFGLLTGRFLFTGDEIDQILLNNAKCLLDKID